MFSMNKEGANADTHYLTDELSSCSKLMLSLVDSRIGKVHF